MQPVFQQIINQNILKAYEDCFSNEGEAPYNIYLVMSDGTRKKLDIKINRKLNRYYNINLVVRVEVEYLVSADFLKMRAEF